MAEARHYRVAAAPSRYLEWVVLVLLLAPLVMTVVSSYHWGMGSLLLFVPVILMAGVMIFAALRAQARYAETAVLRVDDEGMELESEVSAWVASAYQRSWAVAWRDVAQVSVLERLGLLQMRRRRMAMLPIALRLRDWVPHDAPADTPAPKLLKDSQLWRDLQSRPFARLPGALKAQPADFDLMQHPVTRGALFVMALLAGYWLTETFTGTEAWAEWSARYFVPHYVVGAIGAAACFLVLRRSAGRPAIPLPVVAVLSVLLGVTSGLASWSGLLRVNQVAGGPLLEEAYVRNSDCDTLLPRKAELPPIEYTPLARGYWCQFGPDHVHQVRIRRGIGGLYQVDLRPHTKAIREYRRAGG